MKYTILDYLEETAAKYPDKTAFADVNTSVTWSDFVKHSKEKAAIISKYFELIFVWLNLLLKYYLEFHKDQRLNKLPNHLKK